MHVPTGRTSKNGEQQEITSEKGSQLISTPRVSEKGATSHISEKGAPPTPVNDTSKKGGGQNPLVGEVQVPQISSQEGSASMPMTIPMTGTVSKELKGVIVNSNGSFSMTPQFLTWVKNPELQVAKYHDTKVGFPPGVQIDRTNHPKPSMLNLGFTFQGEWARMPKDKQDKTGPLYKEYQIVRVEKYIDEEGIIKKQYAMQEMPKTSMYGLNLRI